MHFTNKKTKGGSVLLLNKINMTPLEIQGGVILSNRNIGITSPPVTSMAKVGGMIDFNKSVNLKSRSIQKKKDRGDENIKICVLDL